MSENTTVRPLPSLALDMVENQFGVAGLKAIATFMHAMGSDGCLSWGDADYLPCDIVMQDAW